MIRDDSSCVYYLPAIVSNNNAVYIIHVIIVISNHKYYLLSTGLDALAYDPHKFAMDYHSIGFRECAAEVARYLVTVEGMDIQDPLRLRLMSHLQCFAAQRELANKQASASSWGLNPLNPNHSYPIPTHHLTNSTNTGKYLFPYHT